MRKHNIENLAALEQFVIEEKEFFNQNKCYAFKGEMGAGKTTLIQLLLKKLGIVDLQGSPTYAIVNQYTNESTQQEYFHLDCYRIKNDYEAFDLGLEELFNEKKTIFIEWPEKVVKFLPEETIWISIYNETDNTRTIDLDYEYGS
ncbi:MAG: tRNA (adenosine(37)-N6)-threonylcarbamoyltransferase complex ATPase subunit type 1 TsaE [Crocinitomicaceae bacterium]|nr:tRNA (adenosine(37)-N6)-threonylcarbamoyltransferase complex ATPase subunit type 1 TsaE [Crocinitomicaceae bacterium]MDG1734818.1 tRNA (adenosine(37)-N6)-threonylcarbamoyltransferase complex ATPase subunit type 1 TsaE [Crocinitomicaceae bacterium]MDG2505186.1 tRNA (adenosine(37)-N6)-threonylcarbamoyltransferase complex ATPase subunit type 1 TsaE [Crocinitomicaceae bacterium]